MDHADHDRVRAAVKVAIESIRRIHIDVLRDDQHLADDFGVTSLDMIEILLDLEDALGVRVSLEGAAQAPTVGGMVDAFMIASATATSVDSAYESRADKTLRRDRELQPPSSTSE